MTSRALHDQIWRHAVDIAKALGSLLDATVFDVTVRGRVIISSVAATFDRLRREVRVGLTKTTPIAGASGTAAIVPQLRFTPDDGDGIAEAGEWNFLQTAYVMAIDDKVIDGGDAQVFPAFEERVNAIRGPLSIVGGPLVGAERFLNDPFRLPEETNDPQADGTVNTVGVDNNGNGVLYDHESSHFNAVYGERPGFDRARPVPFEFTFPTARRSKKVLDVLGCRGDPLDRAATRRSRWTASAPACRPRRGLSGTPGRPRLNSLIGWVVLSLGGVAVPNALGARASTWSALPAQTKDITVGRWSRCRKSRAAGPISSTVSRWAPARAVTFHAESFVDIVDTLSCASATDVNGQRVAISTAPAAPAA